MVQSEEPQDVFVNDHQPFPKCQVQIAKSLIPSPLIVCMQIIALSCFVFVFFFNYLLQCDIPPCKQGEPCVLPDLMLQESLRYFIDPSPSTLGLICLIISVHKTDY